MTPPSIGQPISRLEGPLKVTGAAPYAAEYPLPDLLYAYVVNSTIPKGLIRAIDTNAAKALPGVVEILTHTNRPALAAFDFQFTDLDAPPGTVFKPLYDAQVWYNGQPVAVVVAEDFETARYAATLVRITYEAEAFETGIDSQMPQARNAKKGLATTFKPPPPKPTGNFEQAFAEAPFKVQAEYRHLAEHHNPLELFATTVQYEAGDRLTIYDKTQGTINNQVFIANAFGLPFKKVQVLAPYVGGGFGSGLRPQYQLFLAVMAALHLKRNVRLTLDRKQMFTFGHRPQCMQQLQFGADASGNVTALGHRALTETSRYEDYTEGIAAWSHKLYPADHTKFEARVVPLDVATPLDMRAPGGVTGLHAIECTMDALSYEIGIDPLELRLRNYAEIDPASGNPFTSKALRDCYVQGAEAFGWNERYPEPRSMKRGHKWVGYGMATGIWDAFQFPARVEMILRPDGTLLVTNATTDIGTGTLTVMTQMAADAVGIAMQAIEVQYGDSKKPFSMFQGGSAMTASVGAAIAKTGRKLQEILFGKACRIKGSPLAKATFEDVYFEDGWIRLCSFPEQAVSFAQILASGGNKPIAVKKLVGPDALKLRKHTKASHSAAFAEVEVDEELGTITVTRALTAIAAGKIINPKTAGSQIYGAMLWGISKALHEGSVMDTQLGKYLNDNYAEYHIQTHADVPQMDVIFVDEPDPLINELGIKGVGEVGMVAMPAAIANALYHATGKRITNLPIHFDQLLEP
jgi:xanthine dehydrogenase YagR molybdenum-binding subunit